MSSILENALCRTQEGDIRFQSLHGKQRLYRHKALLKCARVDEYNPCTYHTRITWRLLEYCCEIGKLL